VTDAVERQIVSDLFLSRNGLEFVEELVDRFGPRFGGTEQERRAAEYIRDRFAQIGVDRADTETFCPAGDAQGARLTWSHRRQDILHRAAALPPGSEARWCSSATVIPRATSSRDELRGACDGDDCAARFFAADAPLRNWVGLVEGREFIWMRGEPRPARDGSARFGHLSRPSACPTSRSGDAHEPWPVRVKITSTNQNHPVTSANVVAEFRGQQHPAEIILLGAHYDGHDISQAAMDNATGVAVVLEAARAIAPHKRQLRRTVRCVAFAQEEMGLLGARDYAGRHQAERIRFMLNLDGAGRSINASLQLQGWPEAIRWFRGLFDQMLDPDVAVGDQLGMYSDMFPFALHGIPAATMSSRTVGSSEAAVRGFGHTAMDSLDKVSARLIQLEAVRVARLTLRLATMDDIPREESGGYRGTTQALGWMRCCVTKAAVARR
jgi:hypothetical protein